MVHLKIENIDFKYKDVDVLHDISIDLDGAQFVSILGPNGVGKSTLIHCFNNILVPDSGTVSIDDVNIRDIEPKELAKLIAYVPCTSNTSFPMDVADVVLMGRYPHSGIHKTKNDFRIVHSVLQLMHIDDLALRSFNELSAGQHQKVMLARGLAQGSRILLLDEPTANLDIKHQMEVAHLLKELSVKHDMIVIMICHDINIACRYSDRIIMLSGGTVVADGVPDETITEKNIKDVYGVDCVITTSEGKPHVVLKDCGYDLITGNLDFRFQTMS